MRTAARPLSVILVLVALSVTPLCAETIRWIPAAASNSGLHGSQWTTDLWIYNRVADRAITVYLAFLPDVDGAVEPVEIAVELPVLNPVHIQDVVGSFFGENRPGAIRLRSEHLFEARSRTVNSGSGVGIFGQGIPAVAKDALDVLGVLLGASNLPTANGTRTNLGLLNTSDDEVNVFVFIYGDSYQDYLGRAEIELGPYGWWQGNIFDLAGISSAVDNAMVTPFVLSEFSQPLISYISVLDNASGDGTYIQAVDSLPAYTEALDWTIDIDVTAVDATVDRLTITVDGYEPWVFEDTSEPVQVLIDGHIGALMWCWSVEATSDPGLGGQISVDYTATSSEGDSGGGAISYGGSSDLDYEKCQGTAPIPRWDP